MKIRLESAELQETEVIIRGDVTSEEVVSLLQLLKKRNSGKLILYKEDEPIPGWTHTKRSKNCMRSKICWEVDPLHRSTRVSLSISTVSSQSRLSLVAIIASN